MNIMNQIKFQIYNKSIIYLQLISIIHKFLNLNLTVFIYNYFEKYNFI